MIRAVAAAAALGALLSGVAAAAPAFLQDSTPSVSVAIDLDTEGNSGNSLGENQSCRQAGVGDTFDIDVTVRDVPPVADDFLSLGLAGFGFNINFDPGVINITAASNNLMLNAQTPFERIQANYERAGQPNPFPATTGNARIDYLDLSGDYEDGDGILSRLTIEAVGAGSTTLHLDSQLEGQPAPAVFQALGDAYAISSLQDALITVGQPCQAAPTPFDPPDSWQPTGTPAPDGETTGPDGETTDPETTPSDTTGAASPSPVSIGDTEIAVDAVATDNEALALGPLDDCAAAQPGQSFYIDVTVRDVVDLLAFELPLSFDPEVLRVEDRDVDLFQAAGQGSNVFDASNQTPSDSGLYMAAAVDQADPPDPNSGSGVLVRLTLSAVAEGASTVSLRPVDLNGDGQTDRAVFLRNAGNAVIGDTDGDGWFDGPVSDAEIRVGDDCDSGARVLQANGASPTDDDGGGAGWILFAAGLAALAAAAAGAAYLFLRRRRRLRETP